ncbi:hypothetical protein BGZ88_009582 [Linnemannia elongata]|nr:hypothetical protein BGZ88_009582 [Linnemannia elongata]
MASLGSIFPNMFLSLSGGFDEGCCPKSIDAIFDDPVSTDVVFIWQIKVLMAAASDSDCKSSKDCGSGSDNDSDDDGGHDGRLKRYDVTLERLHAHQAVLHQYPYFRRKLPLRSPSSLGGTPCVLMPRKLLTAAPNDQPFTSNSKQQDGDEARVTWIYVFQLADNMELPELRVRALNMMRQTQQA